MPSLANQLQPQLLMEQFDTLPSQCRHIEHMHEGVWFKQMTFDKMTAMRTDYFSYRVYTYAMIVHTQADKLLPQLLMEQFYNFPLPCSHIEHMHEGV